MSDPLTRIEEKLDRQADRLNSVDVTLARQHVTLEEHMRRTAQNESALAQHFEQDRNAQTDLLSRIKPLEELKTQLVGARILVLAAVPMILEAVHLFWRK